MFGIQFKSGREGSRFLSDEELSAKKKSCEEWVIDLMESLANNPKSKVTFYPYRTASVYDELFDLKRESMLPLEYMLAVKAGVRTDNHTTYEVYDGCSTFYVFCHDDLFRIGKTIEKKRW